MLEDWQMTVCNPLGNRFSSCSLDDLRWIYYLVWFDLDLNGDSLLGAWNRVLLNQ